MGMQLSCKRAFLPIILALGTLPLAAASTWAAPQILSVASTDLKMPMECEGADCSVELTAICLQEHRGSPNPGTAYYVHGDRHLILTGMTPAGQEISLDHLALKIESARGHNAIRVGFRKNELKKYGPLTVQISVPENITIVPMPFANDIHPQTDEDIALATGPLRELAAKLVDQDTGKRGAAELINQAINRLPLQGRASDETRAATKARYDEIVRGSGFSSPAQDNANAVIGECYDRTAAGSLTFRQCLGSWHDRLIGKLNTKYWKALETGS
ncbi:hypothetical protein [Sneathiella sp.]|uniref:hypothetical protein n=1 Tax=Sneathiella sp. TaxID=1964365 RepID=UPI00356B49AB